jgi:hypothetical protein
MEACQSKGKSELKKFVSLCLARDAIAPDNTQQAASCSMSEMSLTLLDRDRAKSDVS